MSKLSQRPTNVTVSNQSETPAPLSPRVYYHFLKSPWTNQGDHISHFQLLSQLVGPYVAIFYPFNKLYQEDTAFVSNLNDTKMQFQLIFLFSSKIRLTYYVYIRVRLHLKFVKAKSIIMSI